MANNRRQGFRLVRAIALHLVRGDVLRIPHVRMLGAYNGALASGVHVCVFTCRICRLILSFFFYIEGPAPPYIRGGLGYIA
jgi:hypothetical protein